MASGTALIAFVPGYATIGLMAPLLVLAGRLLQGFSAGVELGGVSVYLSEMATPGNKGYYVSWQSASQQVAVVFSAALGYGLNHAMPKDVIADWGWRIPFFIGCSIIPVVFYIRRSLQETQAYLAQKSHPTSSTPSPRAAPATHPGVPTPRTSPTLEHPTLRSRQAEQPPTCRPDGEAAPTQSVPM